ncbi:MAG: hypothetical protein Q9220_002687 [cf. Caloplaca sp. 1 TL-2023]
MKRPQRCGADLVHPMRNITVVGSSSPNGINPQGWNEGMTRFVQPLLKDGYDFQSIIILLETHFPHMLNQISEEWIQHLGQCFRNDHLQWREPEDLHNDHLGGDIVVQTDYSVGCNRVTTKDPRCTLGWGNPYGGMAYCPWRRAQELGVPMSPRPYAMGNTNTPAEEEGTGEGFAMVHDRELRWQGMEHWKTVRGETGAVTYEGYIVGLPLVKPSTSLPQRNDEKTQVLINRLRANGNTSNTDVLDEYPDTAEQDDDVSALLKPFAKAKGKAHSIAVMESCPSRMIRYPQSN